MILPDLCLPARANQCWPYSGIDTPERCPNRKHFESYSHTVQYQYNSRGFRDDEWPQDLCSAVWCVGDSFTLGIGSARQHTWPYVLQQATDTRTVNVSMDGASNNWIARQAWHILKSIQPKALVIHWSYLHRREGLTGLSSNKKYGFMQHYKEVKKPDWPEIYEIEQFSLLPVQVQHELMTHTPQDWLQDIDDDDLRLWHIRSDIQKDINNTRDCMTLVDANVHETQLIHSFIPDFAIGYQEEFFRQVSSANIVIQDFDRLDLARDGHHYDLLTSQYFVQQLQSVLT
jgi:hypothetical protein